MGLSEEEEKRGMMVCPKDHENPLCGRGEKWEPLSTCAQSVQRVWKVVESSKSVGRFASVLQTSNALDLIRMVQFPCYVKKSTLKSTFYLPLQIKMLVDAFTLPFALVTYLYSSWINYIWEVHFEKPTLKPKSRMLVPLITWQDDNTEKAYLVISTFSFDLIDGMD